MAKRGPKPKPTALRIFEGNPGNKPLDRREPMPAELPRVPQSPAWLGKHGRKKWDELACHLHAIGCLTRIDLDALAMYCEAWDEFHDAAEEILAEGATCQSEKGGAYQHPAVGRKNKAIARIRQFGQDFGMTPAARVSLKASPSESGDELDDFKKRA